MHRTQIYITDLQHSFLLSEARRIKASLSELIRAFIQQRITTSSAVQLARKEIIGIGKSKERDVGRHHDKYLYS